MTPSHKATGSFIRITGLYVLNLLLLMLPAACSYADTTKLTSAETMPPTIAIIIDDMGNYQKGGWKLINLPYPLTLSFLPKRPFTLVQAKAAHYIGKEVMLHAPMSNIAGLKLGFGALTDKMSESLFKKTLINNLLSIPYAVGVNNHMGSQLTQERLQMNWVMQALSHFPVYFIDSRTIATSVAEQVANEHAIPTMGRDVFLDDDLNFSSINYQFKRLIKIAKRQGTAIAIGHPHLITANYLAWALPKLDEEGIAIATVSGLWEIRHHNKPMYANRKPSHTVRVAGEPPPPKKPPSFVN
jgi:polysaccharide deacetylase 2 family uncharacterized protein YibQ